MRALAKKHRISPQDSPELNPASILMAEAQGMEAAANTTATRIRAEAGESSWTMVDQVSGGKNDGGFGKGNWGGKKLRL